MKANPKPLTCLLTAAAVLALSNVARGISPYYEVYAHENSVSIGVPVPTIELTIGEMFRVTADPTDLWAPGPLPRWSNADGLTGPLYATGDDESGEPAGTLIGTFFGNYSHDGFSAPYGALVGRIGSTYILLGTEHTGPAPESGTLELMYWDLESYDNLDKITVSVVPEPSTVGLGALCLLALVWRTKRRG